MKLTPLHNRVVLKPIESDKVTSAGIILPGAVEEKISLYVVIEGGKLIPQDHKVICSEYAGYDFEEDGEKYKIVDVDSILAIYED